MICNLRLECLYGIKEYILGDKKLTDIPTEALSHLKECEQCLKALAELKKSLGVQDEECFKKFWILEGHLCEGTDESHSDKITEILWDKQATGMSYQEAKRYEKIDLKTLQTRIRQLERKSGKKKRNIAFIVRRQVQAKQVYRRTLMPSGRGVPDRVPPSIKIPKRFIDNESISIYLDRDPISKGLNIGLEGGTVQIKKTIKLQIIYQDRQFDEIEGLDTIGGMLSISEEKSNQITKIVVVDKREVE